MIPKNTFAEIKLASALFDKKPLANGDTVRVCVSKKGVLVDGKAVPVKNSAELQYGNFLAKVKIQNNVVYLVPLKKAEIISESIFQKLNLPDSALSQEIINLWVIAEKKLDPKRLQDFAKKVERFYLENAMEVSFLKTEQDENLCMKDKNVLFSLFLLEETGIEWDKTLVAKLCDALDGKEEDAKLFGFLQALQKDRLSWFVVPYTKELSGSVVRGSLRFLIDKIEERVRKTEILARFDELSFFFALENKECAFFGDPKIKNAQLFEARLLSILQELGFKKVYKKKAQDNSFGLGNMDLYL